MAESAASNAPDIEVVVNEAMKEGWKLTNYLLDDAEQLDAAEGMVDSNTCQLDGHQTADRLKKQWTHHIETGRTPITFGSLEEALSSTFVGFHFHEGRFQNMLRGRPVDFKVFPYGHNIPVRFVQDKTHWGTIPESDQGCYEIIYNIRDGIIIFGHIKKPSGKALESLDAFMPGLKRFMDPCDVIGTMFQKLHADTKPVKADARARHASAEALVKKSVQEQSPLSDLPADMSGVWLPAAKTESEGIPAKIINQYMREYLNMVIVHVNPSYQAFAIVNHIEPNLKQQTFEEHETYQIGQEKYYALLGSDMGQEVAWLLLKCKDKPVIGFGHKAITAISVFHSGSTPEMTTEELRKYWNPVLIFHVVDASDELRTHRRAYEDT